jgi:hypothetical protein
MIDRCMKHIVLVEDESVKYMYQKRLESHAANRIIDEINYANDN